MRVTVQLFALLRDLAGAGDVVVDVPPGAAVQDVVSRRISRLPPFLFPTRRRYFASASTLVVSSSRSTIAV